MQGPSPDFELHDCSSVFHTDLGYEKWKQALVSCLPLLNVALSLVWFSCHAAWSQG